MPHPVIRPAEPADVAAITAIYAQAVDRETASFETVAPDEAEMARRMRALLDGGFAYVVAERDGVIVGYGYAGPYRERAAYRNTVEDAIYLAEAARGQGIGGALLGRLIADSEVRGFRQMIAVIGGSQHTASIRLHKAAGFAMVGTLKDVGYKHERWLDTVIMQRPLGTGARAKPSR